MSQLASPKYGVLVGRFSPLHLGHEAIIQEIINDGLIPFVIVGASTELDSRNPYTYVQRYNMLRARFGYHIHITCAVDTNNWDDWFDYVQFIVPNDSVFYINHKPQDKLDFTVYGTNYTNQYYSDVWETLQYSTKQVTLPTISKLDHINATDIRSNPALQSTLLSGPVRLYLNSIT